MINYFRNLKFVRKLQLSFFALAAISTIIVVDSYFQIIEFKKAREEHTTSIEEPVKVLDKIRLEYKSMQYNLMKFAVPMFEGEFNSYASNISSSKPVIDSLFKVVINLPSLDSSSKKEIVKTENLWNNYRNVVVDAILSAGMIRDFEMAAVVASTSGEEMGTSLASTFDKTIESLNKLGDMKAAELNEKITFSEYFIIGGMLVGTFVFIISVFVLAPTITNPINHFVRILENFSKGDFSEKIEKTSEDEFGLVIENLQKLQVAQKEKIYAAKSIAAGVFENVTPAGPNDELANAFNSEVNTLKSLFDELHFLIEKIHDGDLSIRGNEQRYNGGWKSYMESFNSILSSFITPIEESSRVLQRMAQGDFSTKMTGEYKGDYLIMKENINSVVDSLREVLIKVTETTNELSASAAQISSSSEEMAAGASEQNSQTNDIAAAIEQMAHTISVNTKNAHFADENAKLSGSKAKEGGAVVLQTVEGINRIAEVVNKSTVTIRELGKSSAQIGEIVEVIQEIADQTNLLALNAAIEAARAGDMGRGFAVVADEVRKLAERTSNATKQIADMIKNIQHDTNEAVSAIEAGHKEVDNGKELARKAGEALEEIIKITDENSLRISQLAVASEEQAVTSASISKNVGHISNVTEQLANGTQQISRAAESLYNLTSNLQGLLDRFKLSSALSDNRNGKERTKTRNNILITN